jgi:23S rRNA pseudouridine2605 synthase
MNGRPASEKQGERIAKVMARAGLCSRREAEAWIAAGRVAVNGTVLISPAFNVAPRDRVEVDGKALPHAERTRLFRYHKPRGLMTTNRDPEGRPTLFERLPKELPRLVSVGRLDMTSEGLLLLTNDGGLKRALELPETGWLRRYRVRANGKTTQERLDSLKRGITVEGVAYGPIEAKLERVKGANVWLLVGMREGKNREVRNVLGALGLTVNRLIRVSYGPFRLLDLKPGAIEEVPTRVLREQISEKIARAAGVNFDAPLRVVEQPKQQMKGTRSHKSPSPSPARVSPSPPSPPPIGRGRGKSERDQRSRERGRGGGPRKMRFGEKKR